MANKVVSSSTIKSIMNGGRSLTLKYATETDAWKHITLSSDIADGFTKAMEKADVPENAVAAILTLSDPSFSEKEHPSQKDSYAHYTTTYVDKEGKHITTKHVYP